MMIAPKLNATSRPCTTVECQYLGKGYNIITGDPHADHTDPGWKADIFDSAWITAHGQANDVNICSFESVASAISGGGSAQAALNKDTTLSASVGVWLAKISYTGSDSVNSMNKSAWSESTHFEDSRAACEIMYATLPPPFVPYTFTDDFAASARTLPNASGLAADTQLAEWMGYYGTHFASGVTMGGQMVLRWTMTSSSYSNLSQWSEKTGHSIEAGAKGSFWIFSDPEGKVAHQSDKEATQAFQEATSGQTVTQLYRGGAPFVQGDPQAWYKGLKDALAPVAGSQNELTPISELLTPLNFPGLDPGVKATAEDFLQRLCSIGGSNLGTATCTPNAVDPLVIPPRSLVTGTAILSVAWARDGGNVTTGGGDGYVRTWNVLTGDAWRTLSGHTDEVNSVAYSPDGKHLASGSYDKTVKIWDATTGNCTLTLSGHTDAVESVAYSPDGKHLASGSNDKTVKIDSV